MEKVQTGFRILYRFLIFILLAVGFFISAFYLHLKFKDPFERMAQFSKNAQFFNVLICRFFNVKVNVSGHIPKNQPGLIAGNHMGFIDVLVMNSLQPTLFVTSNEIKETPFLGLLCELSGCLFVERRNRMNIGNELNEIVTYLKRGFNVILYPEATSHNGEEILPFKRTLLTSAAYAEVPIRPYCFNFKSINGEPFTLKYRDDVCWYGPISFARGFIGFASIKELVVDVEFLEPVFTKPSDDRGQVADSVREQIVKKFRPVQKI